MCSAEDAHPLPLRQAPRCCTFVCACAYVLAISVRENLVQFEVVWWLHFVCPVCAEGPSRQLCLSTTPIGNVGGKGVHSQHWDCPSTHTCTHACTHTHSHIVRLHEVPREWGNSINLTSESYNVTGTLAIKMHLCKHDAYSILKYTPWERVSTSCILCESESCSCRRSSTSPLRQLSLSVGNVGGKGVDLHHWDSPSTHTHIRIHMCTHMHVRNTHTHM